MFMAGIFVFAGLASTWDSECNCLLIDAMVSDMEVVDPQILERFRADLAIYRFKK
jgi:hypothetical protein